MEFFTKKDELIYKILEFTKSQGGHIGFKEVRYNGSYNGSIFFSDVSIFSDGSLRYHRSDGTYENRNPQYDINSRYLDFLEAVWVLITDNKYL